MAPGSRVEIARTLLSVCSANAWSHDGYMRTTVCLDQAIICGACRLTTVYAMPNRKVMCRAQHVSICSLLCSKSRLHAVVEAESSRITVGQVSKWRGQSSISAVQNMASYFLFFIRHVLRNSTRLIEISSMAVRLITLISLAPPHCQTPS